MIHQSPSLKDATSISNCVRFGNSNISDASSIILVHSVNSSAFINQLSVFQLIFGTLSNQSSSSITINKSEFNSLTASANNRAESLFVAILLRLLQLSTYANEKIESKLWGVSAENGKRTHTIVISLKNKLNAVNSYEMPDYDSLIKPGDY